MIDMTESLSEKKINEGENLELNEKLNRFRNVVITLRDKGTKLIQDLNKVLGPWSCLFKGKPKIDYDKNEDLILFNEIKNLFQNDCNSKQIILIFLIARHHYKLSNTDICDAIELIMGDCDTKILNFLLRKNKKKKIDEFYPCIMIVDEVL